MAARPAPISAGARDSLQRSGDIERRQSGTDVILSVASDVLFGFDGALLSPEAEHSPTDVSDLIALPPEGQVLVVRHTESRRPDDDTRALSLQRAGTKPNPSHGTGSTAPTPPKDAQETTP